MRVRIIVGIRIGCKGRDIGKTTDENMLVGDGAAEMLIGVGREVEEVGASTAVRGECEEFDARRGECRSFNDVLMVGANSSLDEHGVGGQAPLATKETSAGASTLNFQSGMFDSEATNGARHAFGPDESSRQSGTQQR
jgi:hypothetical protein